MKMTVNVNLGSMPYTMDEDAFMMLNCYLDDIKGRIEPYESEEVIEDIEIRIADILASERRGKNHIVTVEMVRRTIDVIGSADTFGARRANGYSNERYASMPKPQRFYRSNSDSIIAGVCGGIASYISVDPTLVRVVAAIMLLFGGASFWIYIIIWIVVPKVPAQIDSANNFNSKGNERR